MCTDNQFELQEINQAIHVIENGKENGQTVERGSIEDVNTIITSLGGTRIF